MIPVVEGMEPRRVHAALTLLSDGAWWTLAELVRATGAPRRSIEALLGEIGPERSGERFRLRPGQVRRYAGSLADGPFTPADPVGHLLPGHARIVERIAGLIEDAPRGRSALDHVSATPETVVRRALLLGAGFWLRDGRLLCVGDHDLTSLAVAMVHPRVRTTVVDVDERILEYIDQAAERFGLSVDTRWADLRLGLPPSAAGEADLAITDPPYTPDGVGLFVARAVEGLRDRSAGRVLLAYGASERTPALALKVQGALHDLNLLSEAIHPDFNRYYGAESIGSAADLYVLRPTSKTLAAVTARVDRLSTAIYTQGPQATESRDRPEIPPEEVVDEGFHPAVLVGDWPAGFLPKVPRARLTTWLAKPYAAAHRQVAVALPPGLEGALPRVLLASRAEHLRVLTPEPARAPGVAPVYDVTVRDGVLEAVRRPQPQEEAERLLRRIMDRAHGKVANTWRDGLIEVRDGLTKRRARELVAQAAPWAEGVTLLELPLHRLRALPDAVRRSLSQASQSSDSASA